MNQLPEKEPHSNPLLIDLAVLVGIVSLFAGFVDLAKEWTSPFRQSVDIDLSPFALPRYVFYSLCRGLIAFGCSLLFTLIIGFWAAKDARAARIILPMLDILQSIPVLGFMPGLVLALVAIFPNNNIGLELACILMIFTGQVWNMTFSLYHSLRSVPQDLREAATTFGFSPWRTAMRVEMPFAATGLVWNSMMSMAGGWFFLMVTEAFTLGDHDYRLPGIGSYMSVAVQQNRTDAMWLAIVAMMAMIVVLDQLFWKPITVRVQRFRIAVETHREFGEVIQIIEAAEMLGFVDTPKRTVVLESSGREFVDSSPERQRELWHDRVKELPLFREVMGLLERAGKDGVPDALLLTLIDWELPSENLSRMLRTVIRWGRFGSLFEYDERRRLFRPSSTRT